jgi:tetratricopeptide (TPR) repeat protein
LFLGSNPYGGYNSIHGNTSYELKASYNCTINAEINWWGAYPPSASEFYTYQSTIDYTPALNYDPNDDPDAPSGLPISNLDNISSIPAELSKAYLFQLESKYEEAIAIYSDFIVKNMSHVHSAYALIRLEECYGSLKREGFTTYLKDEVKSKVKSTDLLYLVSLELENKYLLSDERYSEVIKNLQMVQEVNGSASEEGKFALYNLGMTYLKFLNDKEKAEKMFSELAAKYPSDELTIDAKYWLGEYTDQILPKNNSVQTEDGNLDKPLTFELFSNYPNPFNPTTKISYQLPVDAHVTLKVYDLLGREVATLLNDEEQSGIYEVEFDASDLSSGIYLYKITMNDFTKTMKMMVVK